MFKKIFLAASLSAAVMLGGCASTGTTSGLPASTDPTVSAVIQAVRQGCAYVAPASQVASIITTFTGGSGIVDLVSTVAGSICNAVTAKGAMRGGALPQVNGVVLTGRFTSAARRPR